MPYFLSLFMSIGCAFLFAIFVVQSWMTREEEKALSFTYAKRFLQGWFLTILHLFFALVLWKGFGGEEWTNDPVWMTLFIPTGLLVINPILAWVLSPGSRYGEEYEDDLIRADAQMQEHAPEASPPDTPGEKQLPAS